jgi:hypothetical protein
VALTALSVVAAVLAPPVLAAPTASAEEGQARAVASQVASLPLRVQLPRRTKRSVTMRVRTASEARVRVRVAGSAVPATVLSKAGSGAGAGDVRWVRLTADEGLRHGRNRIRVVAVDGAERARVVRLVQVRRTAPIAAAGRHRDGTVGRAVELDARASRAVTRPNRLRHRWTIQRAPRDSHARLARARTARPRMVPDVPGRYVLRLRLTERIPGQRVGGRARCPRATPSPSA